MRSPFSKLTYYKLPDQHPEIIRGSVEAPCWVILRSEEAENESFIDLLSKILAAVKLQLPEGVALLQVERSKNYSLPKMLGSLQGKRIIAFGVTPTRLGFQLAHLRNQIIAIGHNQLLITDALQSVATDQQAKRALWTVLQRLFEIES